MAWNQPGGDGKDPWGNRNDQQGPPDLDEVMKKFQAQLGKLFGGKGGSNGEAGGGGGGGRRIGGMGFTIVIVLAIIAWGLAGIYIVDPAEQAVVKRFGAFVRIQDPGPHWAPPFIETYDKVNVQELRSLTIGYQQGRGGTGRRKILAEALMLTEDENIVDLEFAVQYRVRDAADFLFQDRLPEDTLHMATESAVREVVGRSTLDFVLTEGREAVASEVEDLAQEILDLYRTGLVITSVNMQNAQPPQQVEEAFLDAIKAREDQERIINEAKAYRARVVPTAEGDARTVTERANAYKEQVIAKAEGESSRFLSVLEQYKKAPDVTRERLYIETVESVLGNSSKVLLDIKQGNNLTLLPLDQLMQQAGQNLSGPAYPSADGTTSRNSDSRSSSSSTDFLRGRGRGR